VHDTRRTRAVLGVLIVAALVLITVSYRSGRTSTAGGISSAGAAVLGGAENLASSVGHLVTGSGSGGSSGQVQALQKQVVQLRTQLAQEQLSKADYAQLRRLLALAGQGGYRIVAATVIATAQGFQQQVTLDAGRADGVRPQETVVNSRGLVGQVTSVTAHTATVLLATAATVIATAQGFQQQVTLDAGRADGVRPQETVVNSRGLVGQVTSVTAHTATVLLATAATSQVGVRLAPSGQLGFVAGPGKTPGGTGQFELQVLDGNAVLRPGQQLVTSASVNSRPFVAGVPVGVISRVQNRAGALTAKALVRPYVNFTELGVVGIVVVPPRHDPRFSVLPPAPKAKPTPTVTVTVAPRARSGAAAGARRGGG
jgi:rod shape-determining protein MreC